MCEVVGANRKAIEKFQKLFSQDGIAWNLAHHDDLQFILAAFETVLGQQLGHAISLTQGANKRNHHLNVGEAHLTTDTLDGLTLHGKSFAKVLADVARSTAKSQHGVFFLGLVSATANEFAVFIAFEI